jgi:hypothetical protein
MGVDEPFDLDVETADSGLFTYAGCRVVGSSDKTLVALPPDARIVPDGFGGTAGFLLSDGTRINAFRMEWSSVAPAPDTVTIGGIEVAAVLGAVGYRLYDQGGRLRDEVRLPGKGPR